MIQFARSGLLVTAVIFACQGLAQSDNPSRKPSKIFFENLEMRNGVAFSKNRPFTGISVKLWDNKVVNEEIYWVDGFRNGSYKEFTENNVLVASETWAQGVKQGSYSYYYPNGAIKTAAISATVNWMVKLPAITPADPNSTRLFTPVV